MTTTTENPNTVGCNVCRHVEEPSTVSDQMARFTNADSRTDACLRRCGIEVPLGTEVRLCRQHAVTLEQALTIEYRVACPYVQPVPRTSPTVGVDTRPQQARLTTWVGDEFMPMATLGREFRLFGVHQARRVTVQFDGRGFSGVWLPRSQDFVRLRAVP